MLVTGAAGFIGYHLSKGLIENGVEVVGLDNLNDYYSVDLKYARLQLLGIDEYDKSDKDDKAYKDVQANKDDRVYKDVKDVHDNKDDQGVHDNKGDINSLEILNKSKTVDNFSFIKCDLSDRPTIEKLFDDQHFDVVINLAAQTGVRYSLENPHAYISSNVMGFLNILEGCRNHPVKHLIFASSSSVYGTNQKIPFEASDRTDEPISLYAATKKSNELMAYTYAHLYQIPCTGLRFFTVYGPLGRPDMAYYKFANLIRKGKPIDIYNHGKMARDFTYVADVVESIIRLIPKAPGEIPQNGNGDENGNKNSDGNGSDSENGIEIVNSDGNKNAIENRDADGDGGENVNANSQNSSDKKLSTTVSSHYRLFNIGNGSPVNLLDFIKILEEQLGKSTQHNMMKMQPGDVVKTWADSSELHKYIDYKPKVNIQEGITNFVEWYKSYYDI